MLAWRKEWRDKATFEPVLADSEEGVPARSPLEEDLRRGESFSMVQLSSVGAGLNCEFVVG
jgi:hypothetical protein